MLESKHAGYRSRDHYPAESVPELSESTLERIIRVILVFCFAGVLGLELWLLISAIGSG
jgi:hypothetical protein